MDNDPSTHVEDKASTPAPHLSYQPALDGLRAIAIVAVFAYHLGIEPARGGYLGVDVFFVLSGYLITSLLVLEERASGSIDLLRFWVRRAKRLLPALLIVLLFVAVWIQQTAPDFELALRRKDLIWALFYGSNWHLIGTAQDYFAQGAGVSIVRHTWSLAIEEQFYLVWPLVVGGAMWVARGRVRILAAICATGIVSSGLAMALLYSDVNPSRAYYGTDTRVQQLLIGALLAVGMVHLRSLRAPRKVGTPIALGSLALLVTAFVLLGDDSAWYYRGLSTGVAVATAALIWGVSVAREGVAARSLGIRPMRGIGRISYGIYLWHWPIIVAVGAPAAVFTWLPGDMGLNATRVLITFAVAALSFVLVERPILRGRAPSRVRTWPRVARTAAGGLVTATALTVVAVAIAVLTTGSVSQAEASSTGGATGIDNAECVYVICVRVQAQDPGAPVIAVVGDSIGRSFDLGLMEQARREGWTYLSASAGGCRVTLLLTVHEDGGRDYARCYATTEHLHDRLISRWHPDLVIVVDNTEMRDLRDPAGDDVVVAGSRDWEAYESEAMQVVVDRFTSAGVDVALVEAGPYVFSDSCLRLDHAQRPECSVPATDDRIAAAFNRILGKVADDAGASVLVVSPTPYLCPGGMCTPMIDGIFTRYDGLHYSEAGSRWMVPLLIHDIRAQGAFPS